MSTPIAVVMVLNFNGKSFLEECFTSLEMQSRSDFDTYLVDNGSSDGSVAFVKARFPRVKIVPFEKNHGFSAAYNMAVETVSTPYVVFLNNDTVVDTRWLEFLIVGAEQYQAVLVGSKILSYQSHDRVLSAGTMMTPAGVAYEMGLGEKDSPLYNYSKLVGGVVGASMLVRTEIFRQMNGFDEGYFAFCEDLDLCWRLNLLGYKVLYEPRSVLYHWSGGTAGGSTSGLRVYFMQKNMVRTAFKHFDFWNLLKAVGIIVVYTALRFLSYLFTGRWDLAKALLKGSLEPIRCMPKIMEQRRIIQKTRIVSDHELKKRGWISSLWNSMREYVRTRYYFIFVGNNNES